MLATLSHSIGLGLAVLKTTFIVGVLKIASSLPYLKTLVQKFEEKHLLVPYQNFWDDYASRKMYAAVLKIFIGDHNKTALLGHSAPDCKLVTTDGEECRLLNFARGNRPLVVNFGSCT